MTFTNLPVQLTRRIGREHELEEVKHFLSTCRLVTLTGTSGCGKTRLALRVATELTDQYINGVYWVEFARPVDSALVPQAVAKVLNAV
jgi:predicted ATPase